jgi:hypothetical protein
VTSLQSKSRLIALAFGFALIAIGALLFTLNINDAAWIKSAAGALAVTFGATKLSELFA